MDTVSVSLEVLSGILGKNALELQSALMIEKDGQKSPVDQTNIDTYVANAGKSRLTELKDSGKQEFISAGRKQAYKDVEKFISETYGIKPVDEDGWWKKGITEANETSKQKAQTSDEAVKSSPLFKELETRYTSEVQAHQTTKQGFHSRIVEDKFKAKIKSVLSDKNLGLALPENETILNEQIEGFVYRLKSKADLQLEGDDNVIPVGKDGKQLEDQNFNKVNLDNFITNNAKSYWPTQTPGANRQSPPAGDGTGGPSDQGNQAHQFPKWKDDNEYTDWVDKAIADKKDTTYLNAAQAAFESQTKRATA